MWQRNIQCVFNFIEIVAVGEMFFVGLRASFVRAVVMPVTMVVCGVFGAGVGFLVGWWTGCWAMILLKLEIFLICLISVDLKSYVFRQLVKGIYYTSLLLIITLRFACGEKKILSTIKKSQNIMNMIVV